MWNKKERTIVKLLNRIMESLNEKIAAVYAAEQQLAVQTKDLISEIITGIGNAHMDGVKPIKSNVRCATVSLSTIMQNKNNLSPTYYISEYQAEAIRDKIGNLTSLTQVLNFVNEAVETGSVVIKGEKIVLNPAVKAKLVAVQDLF